MRDPKTGRFPPGNGAGWGGPQKGASTSRIKPGDPEGIQRMSNDPEVRAKAARARAVLEEAAPLAAQLLVDIMNAANDPRNMAAAQSILNKTGFHDKSGVEHSGPDGGAIHVRVTIDDAGAEHPGEAAA